MISKIKRLLPLFDVILFSVALSFFLTSCEEDNPVAFEAPEIQSVTPENTFIGDTVTIYGKNFEGVSDKNRIYFDTAFSIPSVQCIKWTISIIKFVVPSGLSSGTFTVNLDTVHSNKWQLNVEPLPPLETVEVSKGSFQMGSANGLPNEKPEHNVILPYDLIVTKYEITQRYYEAVTDTNPSTVIGSSFPVENLTWFDAVAFCNKLSEIHHLELCYTIDGENVTWDTAKMGWRLPSEAEWEYLCKAGTSGDYSGNGELNEMGWYIGNSGNNPHPVGRKAANAFGLYDMHGNVWEWCWDWFGENYYIGSPEYFPMGPDSGDRGVLRGGSYSDGNVYARSSNRSVPSYPPAHIGIRLVRKK